VQSTAVSFTDVEAGIETILGRHEERPVFLTPAWLRTWISEFGEGCEPLFLASTNDALSSVAPLMREDGRVSFIGDPQICDFMDLIVDPGQADHAYVELWRQICAEEWTDLDLWGLAAASPNRKAVAGLAREAGYSVEEELEAVAPRLALPDGWEAYLASLGKKDRHELRRKVRRLFDSGGDVSFEVLSEQSEVVAAMDTFLNLHTGSRQDKTDFMTDGMSSFFRRMASALSAEGLIRLFILQINARPAAAVLCFDAGSYLYLYNSGYDPEFSSLSVGLVSKALCLKWAIENGKKGIDFLRGNEPYKYDLGASDQEIYRLQIRRPA
jgi:CelD/BcsL family acetyltransferase involved in cellulose biosynthesis